MMVHSGLSESANILLPPSGDIRNICECLILKFVQEVKSAELGQLNSPQISL